MKYKYTCMHSVTVKKGGHDINLLFFFETEFSPERPGTYSLIYRSACLYLGLSYVPFGLAQGHGFQ